MSFSVTASAYVPPQQQAWGDSSSSGASTPSLTGSGGHFDLAAAASSNGCRRIVCSSFFQTGFCPDGDFCGFAHHMDELEHEAQVQLVAMMGDALPGHFIAPRAASTQNSWQNQAAGGHHQHPTTNSDFTPYGAPRHNFRPLPSRTNSGSRSLPFNANSSVTNPSSSLPPFLLEAVEERKVQLPSRCRYPHPVPGTYYDYLNIKRNASREAVEEAYRMWRSSGYKAAKAIDQLKADAIDRLVVDAKNVLSNDGMRKEYDAQLPVNTTPLSSPIKKHVPNAATSSNAVAPPVALPPGMFDDIWR